MTFISTHTGGAFYFQDIENSDIDIVDIAHSLSQTNRYNGHTRQPYSVALHSVLVSRLVQAWIKKDTGDSFSPYCWEVCMLALLHDAPEAYIGDMAGPLKATMHAYKDLDDVIMHRISEVFSVPFDQMPEVVNLADKHALYLEVPHMFTHKPEWHLQFKSKEFDGLELKRLLADTCYQNPRTFNIFIDPWRAREAFLSEFHMLNQRIGESYAKHKSTRRSGVD